MYGFEVFDRAGVSPTSAAVIFGIEKSLLPPSCAASFEEWAFGHQMSDGRPDLLVFDGDAPAAIRALTAAGYPRDDDAGARLLRYAILAGLRSEGQELLEEIEWVYDDFGAPADMESFVYYMPVAEGEDASVDGCITRFHAFLARERAALLDG